MQRHKIINLAHEAAQHSFDNHGVAGCSASIAYEFTRQLKYEEFEGCEESAERYWDELYLTSGELLTFGEFFSAHFRSLIEPKISAAMTRGTREIMADVAAGTVPSTCASFSELHDYTDANGYGGAFERPFDNEETDFWNAVQDRLDRWIKANGIESELLRTRFADALEVSHAS